MPSKDYARWNYFVVYDPRTSYCLSSLFHAARDLRLSLPNSLDPLELHLSVDDLPDRVLALHDRLDDLEDFVAK